MEHIIKKGTIVMTFDDILVDTSYAQYCYFSANTARYGKFMDLVKLRTNQEVMSREMVNIPTWLIKKELIANLSKEQVLFILGEIYSAEKSEFLETDYLSNLEPTEFAKKTLMSPVFLNSTAIQKVAIVIRYRSGVRGDMDRKIEFCKKWFGNSGGKYNFVQVSEKESPADIINSRYPKWDMVVTDDLNLVENLAKGDIDHREFLMPGYGYDRSSEELNALMRLKTSTLSYFKPK
jgi:hypothetical protein